VTAAAFSSDCATCHAYSGTAPIATAPLCKVCHKLADPTITATGTGSCLSCHVGSQFKVKGPANPTATFPNVAGAHAKHMNLATILTCDTCHAGSGSGTTVHYSLADVRVAPNAGPAPVSMDTIFKAQSGGSATFNTSALTCSNVSCHGGQTTPAWQGGTMPVNATTYCTACHVVNAAQYNAPTGRHSNPGEHNQTCDYCHDMTQAKPGAQNHFKYLDTPTVSGLSGSPSDQYPSDTILFGSSVTGARTYTVTGTGNAQGKGGCALTCHSETHTASSYHWN
jgi:predicted CxxxxCH...CXXCH cytochrome family protein